MRSHYAWVYKFFMRFGSLQSPGIEILQTLLQSVVPIPMIGYCGGVPQEVDSEMEITIQEGYQGVLQGSTAVDRRGKKQEPAEGVVKL